MSAVLDIRRLQTEQGRPPNSIDWERILTINYCGYIEPGGVVIDVGAHNGMHSRRFRRYLRPTELMLVEPLPELAAGLRREFGRRRSVTVIEAALSATTGTASFTIDETAPGESGLQNRAEALGHEHSTREITVDVRRLDELPRTDPVRFVKVDVEGGELDVLAGATETIDTDRPIISLEFGLTTNAMFGHTLDDLMSIAAQHDLAIFDLLGNDLTETFNDVVDRYYWDYLLIPTERVSSLTAQREAVRAAALRNIENFNPTIERWMKRLRR